MKLHTHSRPAGVKGALNKLRREDRIPCIVYRKEADGETLSVDAQEFQSYMRQVKSGHLPTTIFTLVDETGKERRVLVKEIQYNPINYAVIHLDFIELIDGEKISVKVPIECIGQADCVGVKLGGVLRQVIRHALVRCLTQDIPSHFELDVKSLGLRQSKRIKDLQIPETIRSLNSLEEVVAAIVKR